MDLHTLAVSNLLLLCMYAAVTAGYRIAYRKLQPGLKGADLFIAANMSLAIEIVLNQVTAGQLTAWWMQLARSVLVPLILGAHLLLHRSFAELLQRPKTLWWSQVYTFLIGMGLCLGAQAAGIPAAHVFPWLVSGVQYGLLAFMLAERDVRNGRLSGWPASIFCGLCAIYDFGWFIAAMLRLDVWRWHATSWPTEAQLVGNGAIALSFLLVAASRLLAHAQREAEVDELTGLMNRRGMRREADRIFVKCKRDGDCLSVVTIDLDSLKNVNDQLGHSAGDVLLRAAGAILLSMLRRGDKVARMGGDEFCLLLPKSTESEASLIAERCRVAFSEAFLQHQGERLRISASFGIASTRDCSVGWEEMQRRSDAAMYEAKSDGGNRVATADKDRFAA